MFGNKTWLPKHDPNEDNINRHANMDRWRKEHKEPETKNSRQLRNAKRGRISLPQERATKLVVQYQLVIPENICIQVTLYGQSRWHLHSYKYIYIYIYVHTYKQLNRGYELERERSGGTHVGRVGRRQGKGERIYLYFNF